MCSIPREYSSTMRSLVGDVRQTVKELNASGYSIENKVSVLQRKFSLRRPIEDVTSLAFGFRHRQEDVEIDGEIIINRKSGRVRFYKMVDVNFYSTGSFYSDLDTSNIR